MTEYLGQGTGGAVNCSVILNYNYFQTLSVPVPIVITLCGT